MEEFDKENVDNFDEVEAVPLLRTVNVVVIVVVDVLLMVVFDTAVIVTVGPARYTVLVEVALVEMVTVGVTMLFKT